MIGISKKTIAIAVAVAACGGGGIAAWAAGSGPPDGAPGQFAAAVTTVASQGPPVDLGTLLQRALARVNNPAVQRAAIAPAGTISTPEGVVAHGPIMNLDLNVSSNGPNVLLPEWKGDLVAGVLSDQLAGQGDSGLGAIVINLHLPDGSVIPEGGGMGNMIPGQQFDTASSGSVLDRVRAGAESMGLRVVSASSVNPEQVAPVLVAQTDDPKSFVSSIEYAKSLDQLVGGNRNDLEGYYLEVLDKTTGEPIWVATAANRAGISRAWLRPDLRTSSSQQVVSTPSTASGG